MSTPKHPASVMSLGFAASNGKAMPLIWFPTGYRLNAVDYVKILQEKFLLGSRRDSLTTTGSTTSGAPAHTAKVTQEFLGQYMQFWSKEMWPPQSPDANPLDYSFRVQGESSLYCPPPGMWKL
ncbi:Putative transposable element [Caligus rogercresseyi]|uniref:Transposable element n=1 Tax=Caligus rogercresseyi TaxID=217165 RepID=A0A7T8GN88_CALRO|nr:Putative transposable element [Caligus rogercresseyi]